ncbi:MAG TPA: hypothetical protein VN715_10080 [Roseiarcus sp.]|nr:hypothetical protein [Roseiarcus sp.]
MLLSTLSTAGAARTERFPATHRSDFRSRKFYVSVSQYHRGQAFGDPAKSPYVISELDIDQRRQRIAALVHTEHFVSAQDLAASSAFRK